VSGTPLTIDLPPGSAQQGDPILVGVRFNNISSKHSSSILGSRTDNCAQVKLFLIEKVNHCGSIYPQLTSFKHASLSQSERVSKLYLGQIRESIYFCKHKDPGLVGNVAFDISPVYQVSQNALKLR
jgi:hypothetical protein